MHGSPRETLRFSENELFPSRPVIKCLLKLKITFVHYALIQGQHLFQTGLLEVTEGSQNSGIAVCRETQATLGQSKFKFTRVEEWKELSKELWVADINSGNF